MEQIKLRAHHLLCIQGYSDWGSTPEFKKTMSIISQTLKSKPDTKITLVSGADDLCEKCAFIKNSVCIHKHPPEPQDNKVLRYFGFEPGKEYTYKTISETIKSKITNSIFEDICGTCDSNPSQKCQKAWGIK